MFKIQVQMIPITFYRKWKSFAAIFYHCDRICQQHVLKIQIMKYLFTMKKRLILIEYLKE